MSFSIGDYEEPIISLLGRYLSGEGFFGGSVAETLSFHCQRSDSIPGIGANIYKPFGVIHKQKTV